MAISANRMAAAYKTAVMAITRAGGDPRAMSDEIMTALFKSIVDEIVSNSELVPTSKDSGTAGAGIITGSVK